ncbi:MAG: aconitase X swivel domain-containing protein [Candidatus Lokiarchaeia archaeon]
MKFTIPCRKVYGGDAEGEALVTRQRISFWGGVDPRDGKIIEKQHELVGKSIKDKVLVFPSGKGSSGWSGIFVATCVLGHRPKAIVNIEVDPIVVSSALTADVPMVIISPSDLQKIRTGDYLQVKPEEEGIEVERANP